MAELLDPHGHNFCGITQSVVTEERTCYWPERRITYAVRDKLPRLNLEDLKAATKMGLEGWEAVSGPDFEYTSNLKTANILVTVANLGGPSGVLADAQLVICGLRQNADFQSIMRLDINENWVISDNPKPGEVDIVRVVCHEGGHSAGLGHTNDGGLMDPSYDARKRWPVGKTEIRLMQAGYGTPQPKEPPAPSPGTPSGRVRFSFEAAGKTAFAEWDEDGTLIRAEIKPGARVTIQGSQ